MNMPQITSADLSIFLNLVIDWVSQHGIKIVLIIIVAFIVNKFSGSLIERAIRGIVPANKYDDSRQAEKKRENTLIRIMHGSSRVVVWILTTFIILSEAGIDITPLIAAAGVVGIAFGFGGQYLIKDLISGFFIILENQYRIGDIVCFDSTCGSVEDISLRATILRDLDGTVHHVPHGGIDRVSNLTKQFARVNLDLGVSYSTDLEKAIAIINKVGLSMVEDMTWKNKIKKPIQFERVEKFADSAVMLKVLGETAPLEQWAVAGEFRMRIKIAFDKEGIEIPFPQVVVHNKSN